MNLDAQIESDGNMEYKVVLIARKDGEINDIALRTELAPNIAQYMMGLGEKGGYCPQNLEWKWGVEKIRMPCGPAVSMEDCNSDSMTTNTNVR